MRISSVLRSKMIVRICYSTDTSMFESANKLKDYSHCYSFVEKPSRESIRAAAHSFGWPTSEGQESASTPHVPAS